MAGYPVIVTSILEWRFLLNTDPFCKGATRPKTASGRKIFWTWGFPLEDNFLFALPWLWNSC